MVAIVRKGSTELVDSGGQPGVFPGGSLAIFLVSSSRASPGNGDVQADAITGGIRV